MGGEADIALRMPLGLRIPVWTKNNFMDSPSGQNKFHGLASPFSLLRPPRASNATGTSNPRLDKKPHSPTSSNFFLFFKLLSLTLPTSKKRKYISKISKIPRNYVTL